MKDFLSLAKERYSVRAYTGQPVEQEKLAAILEAGRVAPTAHNNQPQRVMVVQSAAGREKLSRAANLYGAPLALIVCADTGAAWQRSYDGMNSYQIDAAIVTDHMMLEAADLGLGSVWICQFQPDVVKKEFALPQGIEPVNILAVGYADTSVQPASPADRHSRTRLPLEKTTSSERS